MTIIKDSPEHHFLTQIESLKADSAGWMGMHFSISSTLEHDDVIGTPDHIKGKIFKQQKICEVLIGKIEKSALPPGMLVYLFTDGDIVVIGKPADEAARKSFSSVFQALAQEAGITISRLIDLSRDLYAYQKMADARLLGASRWTAYNALADGNRVQSIPLRRQRRDDGLILIVEDDRFTAAYTSNILNKEYEILHAKTGEEAILNYIEHAPDAVFLDIHLPGLSGHETLRALKKADPDACVVMLSVDTAKTNVVSASQEGASGFLKKPFSKDRLLSVVRSSPHIKQKSK